MTHMTHNEQKAILAIALFAAFADGIKDQRERDRARRIADALAEQTGAADLARLYQDVLLRRVSLDSAATALTDRDQRQLAYEMALCVCEADGRLADAERRFLETLKRLLGLDPVQAELIEGEIDILVDETETALQPIRSSATPPPQAKPPHAADAELDKSILNYALLNGDRKSVV